MLNLLGKTLAIPQALEIGAHESRPSAVLPQRVDDPATALSSRPVITTSAPAAA